MSLPKGKRKLLSRILLGAFCLLVIVVSKTASEEVSSTQTISDSQLAVADSVLENVTITGRVAGVKSSKDGNGIVLLLDGENGYQFSAYLSPDVRHVPLKPGDRIVLVGTSSQPNSIAVTKANGIKVLKAAPHARMVTGVEVKEGVGYWQAGDYVARAATTRGDGYYDRLELIVDSYGRKELE